ncbi:hypothetical protein L917_04416 [Phytophthora nicotianae]|uniref:M96 mating-specific protein family n=1 Tax=Phytophthora nicotianae TaxID=4792 RepID=W2LPI1_PHYNI|nr:hypothetical protein L917_04416 [Phytophthora nicotianae]
MTDTNQAMQAFLDGFASEDDLFADTSPPEVETITPPSASKSTRRVTPKQQIDRLKDEIRQLSEQLQTLGADHAQCNLQALSRRSVLWRSIAARQLELRRKSESENHSLREMVKLQSEEAKSLRRLLKRRTRIQQLQEMLEGEQQKQQEATRPLAVAVHEEQAFAGILRDVDGLYEKMDTMFTEKGMHSIPWQGRKRYTDNTVLNGVCFELTQREIMPFGVEKVKDAIWSSLGQLELEGLQSVRGFKTNVQFRKHDSGRDTTTAMVSFFADLSSGRSASVKIRKVVRRYGEEHRTIFIYRTSMEPKLYDSGESVGVHATSALLIELRHDDSDEESTLLQSHFSVTRHDEGLAVGHRMRLPVNLDIAIAVWEESIARIHDQVENCLIESS